MLKFFKEFYLQPYHIYFIEWSIILPSLLKIFNRVNTLTRFGSITKFQRNPDHKRTKSFSRKYKTSNKTKPGGKNNNSASQQKNLSSYFSPISDHLYNCFSGCCKSAKFTGQYSTIYLSIVSRYDVRHS